VTAGKKTVQAGAEGEARDFWGKTAKARAEGILPARIMGWLESPLVLEGYVQERQTGDPRKNWLAGTVERLGIPRGGRWLSLGCGPAGTEIWASRIGLFKEMEALDVSPGSIEQARKAAEERGVSNIRFGQADLNALDLPGCRFDVAVMSMSLHHVKNLEGTLHQVRRTLVPGGWLLANEYIGPRQFQFPDRQTEIAQRLLSALPERLRMDATTGAIKTMYVRHPVEYWNRVEPTESIRSDEILREVERRFEIVVRADYGGTFLHLVLEHIIHNFDPGREDDVAILRMLFAAEDSILRSGVFSSDFTVLAARKVPRWRLLARRLRLRSS
jgi:ubiquinone/menaquinone biosynthesis C-methylase UbiE